MTTASRLALALGAAVAGFVLLIALITASDEDSGSGLGGNGGALNPASVPAQFAPWLAQAGAICPQVTPALLAAQLNQESGFRVDAVSPVGAQGPAQFMPGTWPSWSADDDHNGRTSPFDIADAVMAQGRYMCALASQMAAALAQGRVHGSITDLAIAAYNAGPGGVLAAGGVPANGETEAYLARINADTARFAGAGSAPGLIPDDAGFASTVVAAAQRWLGTPYVWGGGGTGGPTGGGFDCSGLTLNAVYVASGGRITLPHNAAAQAQLGTPVPNAQLRPGDLLFFADSPTTPPHHVGVFAGGTQMVDAPEAGAPVRVTQLGSPYYTRQTITARRFG